ncbi:transposable element Tcb2 transposase [Trichonephila clavipes]|nr:transposable element Tcb2 transposase [Trichonephila clavipes]
MVQKYLHNADLYEKRPVMRVLRAIDRDVPFYIEQRNAFLGPGSSELISEKSRLSADLEVEQCTKYKQSNDVERHNYRGGGIMVWVEISHGGSADLHVIHEGILTGVRYRCEIFNRYIPPYTTAIDNKFLLMDDNAQNHRTVSFENYLQDHSLERMEWRVQSPDLNPIKYN